MSQKEKGLALLPNGFEDVLPPFAEGEARNVRILTDQFLSFGYQLIKPPLLEFEDSLLAPGPGAGLASETFRLMDPVSHRMLGIRSDITAQVARIVSSRLASVDRPLRLTYANDVLRTRGNQMRTQRQFTQVGCELIGGNLGLQGDLEICVLAVLGLQALGIQNITLDFTVPGYVQNALGDVQDDAIRKAVAQRDASFLRETGAVVLADIIDSYGDVSKILALVGDPLLNDLYSSLLSAFEQLDISDVSVSIDPLEQNGFEYHRSFGFTLFSDDISGELGRGGAYDATFAKEGDAPAKGFTLYMDTISKVSKLSTTAEVVEVSCDEPWDKIIEMQQRGQRVVRVKK